MQLFTNMMPYNECVCLKPIDSKSYQLKLKVKLGLWGLTVLDISGILLVEGKDRFGATYRSRFVSILHEVMVHSTLLQNVQMIVECLWNVANVKNI